MQGLRSPCLLFEILVSGRGVWLVIFPSLPSFPSTNKVRPWGTGVNQAWSPSLMGLLPPEGRKASRDSPCDSFGILIVGALWRKSWKANWMWRLEAVREPGPGDGGASRRWPLIPNERKRPRWLWGRRCWWNPSSCVGPILSIISWERGRKGSGRGFFSCVSTPVSNSFLMILFILGVFDNP